VEMPDIAEQEESQKEPVFMHMTPLEVDLQLQAAELVFRSILLGKNVDVAYPEDLTDWQRETLGEEWVVENKKMRREVLRQMREEGENTPMWMEALANMGEIAWHVLESGYTGERTREFSSINREDLLAEFKELEPKVKMSYYARCGAGDRLHGLRACIAVLRLYEQDTEVLEWCSRCIAIVVSDNRYNRDGLVELTLPFPPEERLHDAREEGYSFLQACLSAMHAQANLDSESRALRPLARCLVATKQAPAMRKQLARLAAAPGENEPPAVKTLRSQWPAAREVVQMLHRQHPGVHEFEELQRMLQQ